jgi:hypothetical protein
MLEILQVNHTDYTLPNAADDSSRDKNILRHDGEGWWIEERRFFRLITSVWKI